MSVLGYLLSLIEHAAAEGRGIQWISLSEEMHATLCAELAALNMPTTETADQTFLVCGVKILRADTPSPYPAHLTPSIN